MLHSLCIFVGPENIDLSVWATESLHALITLLTIIETRGHAVNSQKRVLDKYWGGPFSSLLGVRRFDMASNCMAVRHVQSHDKFARETISEFLYAL